MEEFLKTIIKEAGYLAKGFYYDGVEHHNKFDAADLVTEADHTVSKFLVDKIHERFSDHGIISEEEEAEINPGAEYTWVIDPIDGTRNFANHIAYWCVMIGVAKNGQPYLGAIYDAINDELFFAQVGKGSFVNDQPIRVSGIDDPQTCFLDFSIGRFGLGSPYDTDFFPDYMRFFQNLCSPHGVWAYNHGSMLGVCQLAAGRMDAVVLNGLLYHDILAGYVIATEAGAIFTDCKGKNWERGKKEIVVANPKLHKNLMKLFK